MVVKLEAVEFALGDGEELDALRVDVAKTGPDLDDVEVVLRRIVREDCHQVPVTLGAMCSPRATAEKPDLERIELLYDALDEIGRHDRGRLGRLGCLVGHDVIIASFAACAPALGADWQDAGTDARRNEAT